jgi:hypothetical protein
VRNNSLAGDLAGPMVTAMGQYPNIRNARNGAADPGAVWAQSGTGHGNLALAMIGSFVVLLVGAGAAVGGSQWLPETSARTTFAEQQRS